VLGDTLPDGTTAAERLVRYGQWEGKVMELLSYGPRSNVPADVVAQWVIDDGNVDRRQQLVLLDGEFTRVGLAGGVHSHFDFMAVVAVSRGFLAAGSSSSSSSSSSDRDAGVNAGAEKETLKETADGKAFEITSPVLKDVGRAQLRLVKKGTNLALTSNLDAEEVHKTFTHQWGLPFAIPSANITAQFDAQMGRVVITLVKALPSGNEAAGEQTIRSFHLNEAPQAEGNRLRLQVVQRRDAILFQTMPCQAQVDVAVKILEGSTICFESTYTEEIKAGAGEDGDEAGGTKTITRREKVKLPFSITGDQLTFGKMEGDGVCVTVRKPSLSPGEEEAIEIPIQ
jgi:hypothetical protein